MDFHLMGFIWKLITRGKFWLSNEPHNIKIPSGMSEIWSFLLWSDLLQKSRNTFWPLCRVLEMTWIPGVREEIYDSNSSTTTCHKDKDGLHCTFFVPKKLFFYLFPSSPTPSIFKAKFLAWISRLLISKSPL